MMCTPKDEFGRHIMLKKTFAVLLASLFLGATLGTVAGCNTIRGIGQDIERGGEKLQQESNEHRR